ncbi:hypothetical protein G4177_23835 [Corallococcus sp. ZKHCc1 1396]|uniref:DUF6310 domain-containing protein n=1 Tax=Corallococcus soli TaxID=2710757 RepID=A0ABR9PTI6_9BACT|nr:DUF6310 domain-containing protein [Corallococcus soli]MBE4751210.1 hypothetical protein [Corallococcus soli]
MHPRTCFMLLLVLSACATSTPDRRASAAWNARVANLQRASKLPWRDGGRCVVQEAAQPWSVVVERCFGALDHDRIRFHDPTGRCTVASMGAATLGLGEIKTDQFDTYSAFLRSQVVEDQVEELKEEREIARACGYGFVVGVSSEAHKAALKQRDPSLEVVVTGCRR